MKQNKAQKKLRIFFVTSEFILPDTLEIFDGGVANEYYKFAILLKNLGHEVNIVIPHDKNKVVKKDGLKVFFIKRILFKRPVRILYMFFPKKRKYIYEHIDQFSIKYFLFIQNLLKKIDIIQYTSCASLGQNINNNIPSCIRIASYIKLFQKASNCYDKYEEINECEVYTKHPFIYGPCEYIANYIKNDLKLNKEIPIIETPFMPSSKERDYEKVDYIKSITAGKPYFLFFGSLGLLKGCFDIADCIYELFDKYPDLYFVFAGKEWPNNGVVTPVDYLKEKACQYKDRIIYLGRLSHSKLYPVIENSLACVMPSRTENFSNACVEAMALKKIVVGTEPFFNQIITDKFNGFLCKAENPKSLLEKLEEVLALSSEELNRMEQNAYNRTLECSPDKMVNKVVEYYNYVIKNWKRKPENRDMFEHY